MAVHFSIAGRHIGPDHPPYIIAEISGNHLRSLKRARMIFEEAKKAGVDAVKIQSYTPESLAIEIPHHELEAKPQWKEAWGWGTGDIFNLYQQVHTPPGDFTDALFKLGQEFGLTVFSTPFGVEDARNLARRYNPPAYKVGALEIDFFPLLEVLAATKKPLLINTAIATAAQIQATVDFLARRQSGPVALMTGPKVYHADAAKNFGLARLEALGERFGHSYPIGLSDHFRGGAYNNNSYIGHEFATAAMACHGCCLVEKHFRGQPSGLPAKALRPDGSIDWEHCDIDGSASIDTPEMTQLTKMAKLAFAYAQKKPLLANDTAIIEKNLSLAKYGYGQKFLGPSEAEVETNEAGARRYIYARKTIHKGEAIDIQKLHFSRAIHNANPRWAGYTPLPTAVVEQLCGLRASQTIERGNPLFAEELSGPIDFSKPYCGGLFPL